MRGKATWMSRHWCIKKTWVLQHNGKITNYLGSAFFFVVLLLRSLLVTLFAWSQATIREQIALSEWMGACVGNVTPFMQVECDVGRGAT